MVCVSSFFAGRAVAADEDRPDELKVLDLWVGEFDAVMTIKPGVWVPNGSETKLKVKAEWALNGRFLRTEGKGVRHEGGQKRQSAFMSITTYDRQRQAYVGTVYFSVLGGGHDYWGGGFNQTTRSTWNAATRTMTTETKDPDGGFTVSGTMKWIDDDHYQWTSVTKDADGNIMMEQMGKGVRRKK